MSEKRFTDFGVITKEEDGKESQWRTVRVIGLEYIFRVLLLIARIMIYKIVYAPMKNDVERDEFYELAVELNELENIR